MGACRFTNSPEMQVPEVSSHLTRWAALCAHTVGLLGRLCLFIANLLWARVGASRHAPPATGRARRSRQLSAGSHLWRGQTGAEQGHHLLCSPGSLEHGRTARSGLPKAELGRVQVGGQVWPQGASVLTASQLPWQALPSLGCTTCCLPTAQYATSGARFTVWWAPRNQHPCFHPRPDHSGGVSVAEHPSLLWAAARGHLCLCLSHVISNAMTMASGWHRGLGA